MNVIYRLLICRNCLVTVDLLLCSNMQMKNLAKDAIERIHKHKRKVTNFLITFGQFQASV